VQRLLESRLTVLSILLQEKWLHHFEPLLARRKEDIHVYLLEKEKLETLTGFTFYQGVLAVGQVPEPPVLEDLLGQKDLRLLVAVQGLSNAENLGGLVRNCVAFGAQGILVDQSSCSPYLRRAVRASMGTLFLVPVIEKLNLVQALGRLRAAGIRCIAAHPHAGQRWIQEAEFGDRCCVVFGSEGVGLAREVLDACDEAVAIPMRAEVDSLNVGSAAAVFLYEIRRRWGLAIPPQTS
jgi:tRNA G18 (ribose-2'-O)-methylase SpoU